MITVTVGDLLRSDAQTLVNTVNMVGIMGKGIAAAFKAEYPDMFRDYARRCRKPDGHPEKVELGRPYLYRPPIDNQLSFEGDPPVEGKWILNFPTKDHWRGASRLDAIDEGLDLLVENYQEWGITSIAVPPLGCGYGGLEWRVIGPRLYKKLDELDIPVELYAPFGTDLEELDESFLSGRSTEPAGRPNKVASADLAVAIIAMDLVSDWGIAVNQTRLRSIAYFAGAAGIPRETAFSWTKDGIRDEEFTVMARQFVRNGILTESKQGQALLVQPGPTADDTRRLIASDLERWQDSVQQVLDLQTRLREPGLIKIASSVHFAATHRCRSDRDLATCVSYELEQVGLGGSPRRNAQVQTVLRYLETAGFIEPPAEPELDSSLDDR